VGFLLHDGGAIHSAVTMCYITDLKLNDVAAAQLAVDGEVEEGEPTSITCWKIRHCRMLDPHDIHLGKRLHQISAGSRNLDADDL
jgi:hypothetical protein